MQYYGGSVEHERRSDQKLALFQEVRGAFTGEQTGYIPEVLASSVLEDVATLESSGHVQAVQAYLREFALVL